MDKMDNLVLIWESLRTHPWTQEQALVLVDSLLRLVSRGKGSKRQCRLVRNICKEVAKTISPETRSRLASSFKYDSGDVLFMLHLYTLLEVQPRLDVLARLVQGYARDSHFAPALVPKFHIEAQVQEVLAMEDKPGAIFISQIAPCAELLQDYVNLALTEKSRCPKHFLSLYAEMLKKIEIDLFKAVLFPILQRLIRRSASMLDDIADVVNMLSLDLSECGRELIFPSLLEHLFKSETSLSALHLLQAIVSKCHNQQELVRAFLETRDQNEMQATVLLKSIGLLRVSSEYNDQIVEYCLDRSHRLRSDENKQELLLCVSKFASELTPKLAAYFEKEGPKAGFVNVFINLGGSGPIQQLAGLSSLQLAVALSRGIPTPCPTAVKTFLTDTSSSLVSLVPSNAAEALSIARACIKAIDVFPRSPVLTTRISKALLQDSKTRDLVITAWPRSLVTSEVCIALQDALYLPDSFDQFRHNFRRILRLLSEKIVSDEDRVGLIRLITCDALAADEKQKALKYFLQTFGNVLNQVSLEHMFESPLIAALICLGGRYQEFIGVSEEVMQIGYFRVISKLRSDFEKAVHDPEFMEMLPLDTLTRQICKEHGLTLSGNTEVLHVQGLIREVYLKAVAIAQYTLQVHTYCAKFFTWKPDLKDSLQHHLLTKILFQALELSEVPELQEAVYNCVSAIVKHVRLFQPIYFDLVKVLLNIQKDRWKEKSMRKIIQYINEKVSLETVTSGEAHVFNHLLSATVSQGVTNLRTSATHLLSRLVYERKFDSLENVIRLTIHLLETYSSQTVSGLFTTLTTMLQPGDWKSLLEASMTLQPASKEILLNNLLQYEDGLPERSWVEAPLWLLLNDDSAEIVDLAVDVWHKFKLRLSPRTILDDLSKCLFHASSEVQGAAARGLAAAWALYPELERPMLDGLLAEFRNRTKHKDGFPSLLTLLVPGLASYSLELLTFVIQEGVVETSPALREHLIHVGIQLIKAHGKNMVEELFEVLEHAIEGKDENSKLAAVLLLGNLAQHLPSNDLKVNHTIDLLLKALNSKHEAIYQPVADCLPRLISYRRDQGRTILEEYMKVLFSPLPIADKRGSAYGLASILKGLGIDSFVRFKVLEKFDDVINSKKATVNERGSVLLALEGLASVLKSTFEPYLPEVMPFILDCYSDLQLIVQAQLTTKTLISGLSAHGVRGVLPLLTSGLEDSKWKSKIGAIEALGKMAFCAPKQLSECLPEVVPQVIRAFTDTHPEVFQAATLALADIGSVITNPEISEIVPTLIKALSDASTLKEALSVMLETNFMHYIDAPSLSILIPIVEGGLKSRLPEVKKMASQVVGGILALVPSIRSIIPYIDRLILALKSSLFDSIPEVRNVAAQNLGSLCKFIGLQQSQSIITWLESIFFSETSTQVERSGAAHAYSEVIVRVAPNYWEQVIGRILQMCYHENHYTRMSFLGILIFLPDTTKGRFEDHLYEVLPGVLDNLSHENDDVRSVAVRIMQIIIKGYCRKYLDKLLVPLEAGLFASNYKTRQSSIILVGEMMEIIESMDRREGRKEGTIPPLQKNRILSAVYILRSDHTGTIHTQAAKIWKALVENTPRVVPTLTVHVVERLLEIAEAPHTETLNIVTAAIQNILEKYEEKLFQDYLNQFAKHYSAHPKGVAIAMKEVCDCATRKMFNTYPEPVVRILKQLLISEDAGLLASAGDIFSIIYEKVGVEGGRDFLMLLLQAVEGHPKAYRQLMKGKNQVVLKIIMPVIMKSPQKSLILREVGDLVANEMFNLLDFKGMFGSILKGLKDGEDMLPAISLIVSSLTDYTAVNLCLESLIVLDPGANLVKIVRDFATNVKLDYLSYVPRLLELVIPSIHSSDPELLELISPSIAVIIKPVQKEDLYTLLSLFVRELSRAVDVIPAFNVPRGLDPFISILQNSLITGPIDLKESVARAYFDTIRLIEPKPLEAYIMILTGPLIRIMSERVPFQVRIGALDALQLLIKKGATKLKTFIPQLRTVFIKAIQNSEMQVRQAGIRNLLELMPMDTRIDLVINELCSLKGDSDAVISSLEAVGDIVKKMEVPQQVCTSATNKLLGELDSDLDLNVLEEVGKLLAKVTNHPPSVIQSLKPMSNSVIMLGHFLAQLQPEQVVMAAGLYAQALRTCFSDAVLSLITVAQVHPKETFLIVRSHFQVLVENMYPIVWQLFMILPPKEYCREPDQLVNLVPALAILAAATKTQSKPNPDLDKLVIHIFKIRTSGVNNVLKVLHLLTPDLQDVFRDYAYGLVSS